MVLEILSGIRERARTARKRIALADAFDERMIQAAREATEEAIAEIVLVGSTEQIHAAARRANVSLEGIALLSPGSEPTISDLTQIYYTQRAGKLTSIEAREELLRSDLLCAATLANAGEVDGVVAGSLSTTSDVIRAALRGIGLHPPERSNGSVSLVSSMFLMCYPPIAGYREKETTYGFGDCAVIPDPSAEELADIAIETSRTFRQLTGLEPVTAMLSFSTKGSAHTSQTEKVVAAIEIARGKAPELLIDGELQFDAALVPEIGLRKAAGSDVAGKANVFIFPTLDAGNIGYKIAERLGMGQAIGPILQGLRLPMNDLSRGASVSDIVNMIAITAVQST